MMQQSAVLRVYASPKPGAFEAKRAKLAVSQASDAGAFEGYASVFGVVDSGGDVILPGAFAASLQKRGAGGVKMLWQHQASEPIGVWSEIVEDGRGLKVKGQLDLSVARAREALSLLRSGAVDGLSIGFRAKRATSDRHSGARKLFEIDLWEISIVTFPMLTQARIEAVKRRSVGPPPSIDVLMMKLARLKAHNAAENFETKLRLLSRTLEQRYSPNQPRAPAGSREGGQWTSGGGGNGTPRDQTAVSIDSNVVSDAVATSIAQNQDSSRYTVDLQKEEGYGHALRDHVDKTDAELIGVLDKNRRKIGTRNIGIIDYQEAEGSFLSEESANDFVNRTLEANKDAVDALTGGVEPVAVIEKIFGYVTGKEAFRPSGEAEAYIRHTYGVRVVLHADPSVAKGYRVRTSFPMNKRPRQ